MFRRIFKAILMVSIGSVVSLSANAQSPPELDPSGRWINGVSEPWWFEKSLATEDVFAVQKKWVAIEQENRQSPKNKWSGDYFEGSETHGDYLRWSPKNGFVWLRVNKCMATVMSFSYGEIVSTPHLIQMLPQKAVNGSQGHGHISQMAVRFLPVVWRKSQHLVSEDQIDEFGNYVAGVGTFNDWAGSYLEVEPFFGRLSGDLKEGGDNSADASKVPIVPPGYERFIKKPIYATVASVSKAYRRSSENEWWDDFVTPVKVKLSRIGAQAKMKFRISDSDEVIEITNVRRRLAEGIIVRPIRKNPCVKFAVDDDCSGEEYAPIEVGLKASTSIVH